MILGICKMGILEILKICCVNVDESLYMFVLVGCYINVNSGIYNIKVVFYGFKWICFVFVVNWIKKLFEYFCRIVVYKINNLDVFDFLKICYIICIYRDVMMY